MPILRPVRRRGFAMIEVLVAWLILSAGLLGLSILLTRSLAHARSGLYRTAAVGLADDLAESIRANPAGAAAYDAGHYGSAFSAQNCTSNSTTVTCTPAQLAESDLALWVASINASLSHPGPPSIQITAPAVAGSTGHYRIQIWWQEPDWPEPLIATSDLLLAAAQVQP